MPEAWETRLRANVAKDLASGLIDQRRADEILNSLNEKPKPAALPAPPPLPTGRASAPPGVSVKPPTADSTYMGMSNDGSTIIWRRGSDGRAISADPHGRIVGIGTQTFDANGQQTGIDPGTLRQMARPYAEAVEQWKLANPLVPLPPEMRGAGAPRGLDLTAGEYEDFFAVAKQTLTRLGVLGRDPTDAEIVLFAKGQYNADTVLEHYSNVPEIIERQPGVPYGLTLQEYEQRTREIGEAYRSVFPGQGAPAAPGARASKTERQGTLVGRALTERIGADEFTSVLETFRQERGRAPTTDEFLERRGRPQRRLSEDQATPAYQISDRGPVSGAAKRDEARPAV